MSSPISNALASTAARPLAVPAASNPPAANSLGNEDMFLQLLVAQLKYQDPESPADGIQFVTQLAQFSQLEQATQMVSDLDQIKAMLASNTAPAGATIPSQGTPAQGTQATPPGKS